MHYITMQMPKKKTVGAGRKNMPLQVRLDDSERARVDAVAARTNLSVADLLRVGLSKVLLEAEMTGRVTIEVRGTEKPKE